MQQVLFHIPFTDWFVPPDGVPVPGFGMMLFLAFVVVTGWAGWRVARVGLPREMFTPTFTCSRSIGWTANIIEQAADNRLIRPTSKYVGSPPPQPVPTID